MVRTALVVSDACASRRGRVDAIDARHGRLTTAQPEQAGETEQSDPTEIHAIVFRVVGLRRASTEARITRGRLSKARLHRTSREKAERESRRSKRRAKSAA
jgi:hypothetical protein